MNGSRRRSLLLGLAVVLSACTAGTPAPASPSAAPSASVPATAAATPSGAPSQSPTATPPSSSLAPSPSSSLAPSPSPSLAPSPSPTSSPAASPSVSPSPAPTVQPGTALAVTLDGRLRDVLNQQRSSRRIPGLVAAIIYPDGSIWGGASGQSQLEPSRRSTPYTPYVVGSITKTFIAATIMELVEEGALALDDPLSDWLPDYPRAADMTLRHLLSHTSGVHNYFEQRTYNTKVFKTMKGHHWAPQEILDTFAEPPYFAPGAGYYYSNTNFILLGMVIEAETGMDLDGVLDERFITPLGLSDTYFQDNAPPPPTAAHGYLLKSSGYKQVSDSTNYRPTISAATVAWAAGAIVASPRDIARWGHELYGGNLLEPESLAEMTDYNYSTYAKGAYGLGTRTRIYDGTRMFGHTGSLRGFVGAMWHYVEADLTIVVLTNRGRIDANPIIDALAAVALAPSRSVAGN